MNDYGKSQASAPLPRPDTELDGIISEISALISSMGVSVSEIYGRVVPPAPQSDQKESALASIRMTYADKLIGLRNKLSNMRDMLGELNGKI